MAAGVGPVGQEYCTCSSLRRERRQGLWGLGGWQESLQGRCVKHASRTSGPSEERWGQAGQDAHKNQGRTANARAPVRELKLATPRPASQSSSAHWRTESLQQRLSPQLQVQSVSRRSCPEPKRGWGGSRNRFSAHTDDRPGGAESAKHMTNWHEVGVRLKGAATRLPHTQVTKIMAMAFRAGVPVLVGLVLTKRPDREIFRAVTQCRWRCGKCHSQKDGGRNSTGLASGKNLIYGLWELHDIQNFIPVMTFIRFYSKDIVWEEKNKRVTYIIVKD